MDPKEAARLFEERFVAALDPKAGNEHFERLRKFINGLTRPDSVHECLLRYMEIFAKHENDRTKSRTLTTFYFLLARRIEVAPANDAFVGTLDATLRGPAKPPVPLQARFALLQPLEQQRIRELMSSRTAPKTKAASVIGELRAAYQRKNDGKAGSLEELLDFDPLPDEKLRGQLVSYLKSFNGAYEACLPKPNQITFIYLRSQLNLFREFVKQQYKDPLRLFQLMRYWRQIFAADTPSPVDEIAYVQIAAGLISVAAVEGAYPTNRSLKGLTEEEMTFVLRAFSKPRQKTHSRYISSYRALLVKYFTSVPEFLNQCDLYLRLRIFAKGAKADLATEEELVYIIAAIDAADDAEFKARTFTLKGKNLSWHAKDTYKIGDFVGSKARVVYFEGERPHDIYVLLPGAPGLVFKVWIDVLVNFANNDVFEIVFENNKHLLRLIPAFFELLMYLPGIAERGFIGVIQMALDPAVEWATGELLDALGFDPSKAGLWVGGLALLTHRVKPHLGKQKIKDLDDLGLGKSPIVQKVQATEARAVDTHLPQTEARALKDPGVPVEVRPAEPPVPRPAPARPTQLSPFAGYEPSPTGPGGWRSQGMQQQMQKVHPQTEIQGPQKIQQPVQPWQAKHRGPAKRPEDPSAVTNTATASTKTANRVAGSTATVVVSPANLEVINDARSLSSLRSRGFTVEKTDLKNPKSGGGRYQSTRVTGTDKEWKVTSPSGVGAEFDGIARDPLRQGGLLALEAKATFVADVAKSAHIRFYPDKLKQVLRQLVICVESKGLMRLEIVCNADEVAETYLNIVAQRLAQAFKKEFPGLAKAAIETSTDAVVRRLNIADVERVIDEYVNVSVSKWGKVKGRK